MPDVNNVVGRVESTTGSGVRRVTTEQELEKFLPMIAHHEKATMYAIRHYEDPDTIILYRGQSCIMASIIEHDFFGRIALIVWGQNRDNKLSTVHEAMQLVQWWAKDDKKAVSVVAFVGEEGPWGRIPAFTRLTGLKPFRMVFAQEL
jgi:hypothetical protein